MTLCSSTEWIASLAHILHASSEQAQNYPWTWYDLQYIVLGLFAILDLLIIQHPSYMVQLSLILLFSICIFLPYIRRFILPATPVLTWLLTFYACQFIPTIYRPQHIFVTVLPALEQIIYGAHLSDILSKYTHPVLDVLAWLPYGVLHFSFPFLLSLLLFYYGPPGCLPVFGQAFGYMNISGVLTQLIFPNASPWYALSYGSMPATYSVPGEAGGLTRIDELFGLSLYGSTFRTSPVVFGAFPSLHSGSATLEMLFLTYLFPQSWPWAALYVLWLWWSTLYFAHHYLIDLVGGSIYAVVVFCAARTFLPRLQNKQTRFDYLGISPVSFKALVYSIEHSETCFIAETDLIV
ncbi:hypothetical protein BDF14DRAFT_1825699 [Spinellus fusiger]|nr:hypothetical protein BDF14DRAFT_1825699 [Spinellus fusiger]